MFRRSSALFITLFAIVPAFAFAQGVTILGPPAPEAPAVFAKDDQGRIIRKSIKHAQFNEAWIRAGNR